MKNLTKLINNEIVEVTKGQINNRKTSKPKPVAPLIRWGVKSAPNIGNISKPVFQRITWLVSWKPRHYPRLQFRQFRDHITDYIKEITR